jgi:hypothetical protein
VGYSRPLATVATNTVARIGLWFPDIYITRGYVIIRGRNDQSYLRIGSMSLGVAAAIGEAMFLGFRGYLSSLGLYPCPWGVNAAIGEAAPLDSG